MLGAAVSPNENILLIIRVSAHPSYARFHNYFALSVTRERYRVSGNAPFDREGAVSIERRVHWTSTNVALILLRGFRRKLCLRVCVRFAKIRKN